MIQPATVPPEQWSRPLLQRRELGPMMHDLGHTILDIAQEHVLAEGISLRPTNPEKLAQFGSACIGLLRSIHLKEATSGEARRDSSHAAIQDLISSNRRTVPIKDTTEVQNLTYYDGLYKVVDEGLSSGVVSPLQLYRTVKIVESDRRPRPFRGNPQIRAGEAAKRIMSDGFQTMLHQLATNPNTVLGGPSASAEYLRTSSPEIGFGTVREYGLDQTFLRNRRGKVVGFTPEYLAFQKEKKQELRQRGLSGGCPVRHADFPVLGERAKAYFEDLGRPDGQPQNQGESLITRASRFVCTALYFSTKGVSK